MPENTYKNVDKSLTAQAKRTKAAPLRLTPEQEDVFANASDATMLKYLDVLERRGHTSIKTYLEQGGNGLNKLIMGYGDKSAGVSTRFNKRNKRGWAQKETSDLIEIVLTRLLGLVVAGEDIVKLDAISLVEYGLKDVQTVEMKNEVHAPKKMTEERYRLLWVSSVIDMTVQGLLHKADNEYFIESYQLGVCDFAALGLGHDDNGVKRAVEAMLNQGLYNNVTSDVSAFDFSVDEKFIQGDGQRRSMFIEDKDLGRLVELYSHVLSRHVIANGEVICECKKLGITTSGQLSTTSQNTYVRGVTAHIGGCTSYLNLSDDLVAATGFDATALIPFGFKSREVEENAGIANFTSHKFDLDKGIAYFQNTEKCLWNLYNTCTNDSDNPQRFASIASVHRHDPEFVGELDKIAREFSIEYKNVGVGEGYMDYVM